MGASIGVLLLGFAAMGYQSWYKAHVLEKMEKAFEPGLYRGLTHRRRSSG